MTAQQIFDKVCEHLAQQGCRATEDGVHCEYLTADGRKCAVGALLPDTTLNLGVNGSVGDLILEWERDLPSYIKDNEELLSDLQNVHDTAKATGLDGGVELSGDLEAVALKHLLNPAKAALLETVDWKG